MNGVVFYMMGMVWFCKLAGVVCVMGAAGYLSVSLNQTMDRRNRELRSLYSIFLQLKSEIQYMNNTLPECFLSLSKGAKDPFREWLKALADQMDSKENAGFADIWKKELTHLDAISALTEEDLEPLKELSDKLGSVDITAQLKAIDYALLHLERNRTTLEGEMEQKKKVIVTLSLFCGFMTLIILF